jgi:hypothetical protein
VFYDSGGDLVIDESPINCFVPSFLYFFHCVYHLLYNPLTACIPIFTGAVLETLGKNCLVAASLESLLRTLLQGHKPQ